MAPLKLAQHVMLATESLRLRRHQATLILHDASQALDSRKVIGMAVGMLMQQFQLNEQAALETLRRRADKANLKVREIAAEMVDEAGDGGMTLPPSADC